MMREWATVVSWQNGIATLHSEMKTSCNSCSARKGCGSQMLNKLGPKNAHVMKIASADPLKPGQRIELGITEKSLLGSAVLIYMTPLAGLFSIAGLFQMLFHSDLAAAMGAALGGVGGFIVAKGISTLLSKSSSFQPVILNVSLPPDVLQVKS
ncbi:SoxR-reducing system protein RseC [Erwinia tracheiphila]|uniref:SoxR-reducing system protein RseC n=1 Tax=Erwinia tracheiphila TaxID=65700 RepID=A0A0M2KAX3_9GAMM|nr:SoxR-reducing system protein RseC [Erwinia tracheiphila]AXF75357.1 SoxR-reducing system protein RseC [Erwinia tracheiphila]EOS92696.1 SoxR reducing system protein RseC [Erwinia tracheiphila PSU-1]KKF34403.1 SoxR reducing system protein RseC [Erwinia tracheiphila]UIA82098.1 SoxR-reducing system protein RseC [Erwinia tracheiphila]UIA89630.1 SoxR-reducing system protein RseC [Erwinia tracheiphila]